MCKWIGKLTEIAFGEMRIIEAGSTWPTVPRQVISAEDHIDKWEEDGVILTVIFFLYAVVPMMVLGRGDQIFQRAQVQARVRMDEHGMDGDHNNVYIEYDGGETAYIQRNIGEGTG